jgi:hypothetical protein
MLKISNCFDTGTDNIDSKPLFKIDIYNTTLMKE